MIGITRIYDEKHMNVSSLLTSMLLLAAAVFILASYAQPAFTEEIASGTVIAVDAQSGYLTLNAADRGEFTVNLDRDTSLWMCDGYRSLSDIKVGDMVDISYHENGTWFVAGTINDRGAMGIC